MVNDATTRIAVHHFGFWKPPSGGLFLVDARTSGASPAPSKMDLNASTISSTIFVIGDSDSLPPVNLVEVDLLEFRNFDMGHFTHVLSADGLIAS